MSDELLSLYAIAFFISLWLGFYLLARDLRKPSLRLTGLGLGFYAAAIFLEVLQNISPMPLRSTFTSVPNVFIYLPALLWTGGLLTLVPESVTRKERIFQGWQWVVLPLTFLAVVIHGMGGLPPTLLATIVGIPLTAAYGFLLFTHPRRGEKFPLGLPLLATVFFGLAVGLALPFTWLPQPVVILSIGVDLACLGIGIAIFDAFEEGHRLRDDMLRSFITTLFLSMLFVIQIALVFRLAGEPSFGMWVLLYSTLSTTIAVATLSDLFISSISNWGIFENWPKEQIQLRTTAGMIDRVNVKVDFHSMGEGEFHRLTRKAISYLGDLPRLASSPLTYLPLVTDRLQARNARSDSLERAHELKALLTESIHRLKPPGDELFGMSDAWRYFNALYFPYVVGLKPSRRYQPTGTLKDHERTALEWFRTQVPERTLHNWQTTAAKLVTQDLKDRIEGKTFD